MDVPPGASSTRLSWLAFFLVALLGQGVLAAAGGPAWGQGVALAVLVWIGSSSFVQWTFGAPVEGVPCRVEADTHVDLLLPEPHPAWTRALGPGVLGLAVAGVVAHALSVGPPLHDVFDAVFLLPKVPIYLAGVWMSVVPDGAVRHVRLTPWGMTTRVLRTGGGLHAGVLDGRPAPFLFGAATQERGFPFAQLADVRLDGTSLVLVDVGGAVDHVDLSAVPVAAREAFVDELVSRSTRARVGLVDDPEAAEARRSQVRVLLGDG